MVANTLYNCALFIDGVYQAGTAKKVTPPALKLKTDEHRSGGMDAPVKRDMGMEALTATFVLDGDGRNAMKFFGLADESAFNGVFRGAFKDSKGAFVPAVITLRGMLAEVNPGDWTPGEKAEGTYTVELSYYKLEIQGRTMFEIDPRGGIRIINGKDQLVEMRNALGI